MILLKKIKKNNLYLSVPFFSEKGVIKKYGKIDKIIIINSNKFLETTINFLKPFIGNEILQKTFVYDNIKLASLLHNNNINDDIKIFLLGL